MINIESNKKNSSEVECNITKIIGYNYTLFYKDNEILDADFPSTISFINIKDILASNFGVNNVSKINRDIKRKYNLAYYRNNEGDNKPTLTITIIIIIAIIIAIAAALGIILYLHKEFFIKFIDLLLIFTYY